MLRSYFTIAWRNLIKNRTLSLINIIGLSLSIAFCLLLFFYLRYEGSYDRFHVKKNRLFRLEATNVWDTTKPAKSLFSFLTHNAEANNTLVWPVIVARDIKAQFPEVTGVTRWTDAMGQMVSVNMTKYKTDHLIVSDANFFTTFSFRIKRGDPTALNSPNNVVLSQSTAKLFFGDSDPIGRTIAMADDSTKLYTVAAIAMDAPANSSIKFSIVIPLEGTADYAERVKQRFNQSSQMTVIELAEHVDRDAFELRLNKWAKSYFVEPFVADFGKYYKAVDFTKYRWYMRPFAEAHYNVSRPWGHYTDAKNIYQLICIVVVILLIASLNYVLLIISNAATRSQEVGVRKVLGAGRRAIVMQFWVETQILIFVSIVVGWILCCCLLPVFNLLMGTGLHVADLSWTDVVGALLGLGIVLGLMAGYYPALVISKMKITTVLKGYSTFRINPGFSNVLVGLQFTACIVLMVAAFVIDRQMRYVDNKDLGFDKEQVLMVENPVYDKEFTARMRGRLQAYAATQPDILLYSAMNGGLTGRYNMNGFQLNGEQKWRAELAVDYDYFKMLGLKFVIGRPFSRAIASDTSRDKRPIVVNESLWQMLGKEAKLGEYCAPLQGRIIGVVKDYHFESLAKKVGPEEHRLAQNFVQFFMFKVRPGRMQETIANIEKEWKSASGNYPFTFRFMDEDITKMYEADRRWERIMQTACFFAIFIACLGLFGLSAINAINRTKEIGIRKVLGAELKDIFWQLSRGFFIIVGVAIVIATPLAWWMMNKWLEDFAYRITIGWWMFALVGASVLVIAMVTVSYQAVKAALVNPVDSLRSE